MKLPPGCIKSLPCQIFMLYTSCNKLSQWFVATLLKFVRLCIIGLFKEISSAYMLYSGTCIFKQKSTKLAAPMFEMLWHCGGRMIVFRMETTLTARDKISMQSDQVNVETNDMIEKRDSLIIHNS